MPVATLRNFLKLESSAGILLVAATALALVISNSPLASIYTAVLNVPLVVAIGDLGIDKPLLLWINDGLMAVFFFLIGLEVKREVLAGQLASRDQLVLPAIAALGGFAVPACIYAWMNWNNAATIDGWAIPAATDIAFALGVLMLLGSRVPLSIKIFLTTVAIFDDIAAIVVIALFYTDNLSTQSLIFAIIGFVTLFAMNRLGVRRIAAYILVGVIVWVCVLKSGIHATLAGFVTALTIPFAARDDSNSPLLQLEHALHPWVAYMILPIFAFANAGVSFAGITTDVVLGTVSVGIATGLFVGKQVGVFAAVWLAVKSGLARMPQDANWLSIYGVALLTGIGFTMSLFIGSLAFESGDFDQLAATRIGVLTGSLLSAVAGFIVLRLSLARDASIPQAAPPA